MAAERVIELVLRDRRTIALSTTLGAAMVLFDMLGIRPGERRTTFATVVPFGRRFPPLFAIGALLLTAFKAWTEVPWAFVLVSLLFSATPLCTVGAAVLGLVRERVVVGAEGFVRRWLF